MRVWVQGQRRRVLRGCTTDGDCCTRVRICPVQVSCRDGINGRGPRVRESPSVPSYMLLFCPCPSAHLHAQVAPVIFCRPPAWCPCILRSIDARYATTCFPRLALYYIFDIPAVMPPRPLPSTTYALRFVSCIMYLWSGYPFRICRPVVLTSTMIPLPPFPGL